jgi:hypothetical protein
MQRRALASLTPRLRSEKSAGIYDTNRDGNDDRGDRQASSPSGLGFPVALGAQPAVLQGFLAPQPTTAYLAPGHGHAVTLDDVHGLVPVLIPRRPGDGFPERIGRQPGLVYTLGEAGAYQAKTALVLADLTESCLQSVIKPGVGTPRLPARPWYRRHLLSSGS